MSLYNISFSKNKKKCENTERMSFCASFAVYIKQINIKKKKISKKITEISKMIKSFTTIVLLYLYHQKKRKEELLFQRGNSNE